eukprot:365535-Chlamydomonas_euryale.AAC.79
MHARVTCMADATFSPFPAQENMGAGLLSCCSKETWVYPHVSQLLEIAARLEHLDRKGRIQNVDVAREQPLPHSLHPFKDGSAVMVGVGWAEPGYPVTGRPACS